jgi:hypothetical protein
LKLGFRRCGDGHSKESLQNSVDGTDNGNARVLCDRLKMKDLNLQQWIQLFNNIGAAAWFAAELVSG